MGRGERRGGERDRRAQRTRRAAVDGPRGLDARGRGRPRDGARAGGRPRDGARGGGRPRDGVRGRGRPRGGARGGGRPMDGPTLDASTALHNTRGAQSRLVCH